LIRALSSALSLCVYYCNFIFPPSSIQDSVQTEVGAIQERSFASISGSSVTSVFHDSCTTSTDGYGYVIVIDNLDMDVRRSFQRINRSTESMHFCHAYVVLNRFDTSGLEDRPPSGVLSYEVMLPDMNDLQVILNDFKVLVSQ